MLELLSGPNVFLHANDPGSPVAVLGDVSFWNSAFYDDTLGLCAYSATLSGYCIAQLDGAAHLRSLQNRANNFTLDLQRPGQWLIHASLFEDALYEFNKGPGTFGALVLSGGTNFVNGVQVRASDRYLSVIGNSVQYKPLDLSGSFTSEATLTGGGGTATISPTNNNNIIVIGQSSGTACLYDVEAREQIGEPIHVHGSGTNVGLHYSPKHDIFIRMTTHGIGIVADALEIYANAVRPSSLSSPAAVSPLAQGRVSQVKVRLLGSNSDACVGELINWSITAGAGALKEAQSATGADGYAYNDYVAPASGGAGSPFGSVTIQASVAF